MESLAVAPEYYVLDITIPGLPPTYNSIGRKSHWVLLKHSREWKDNVASYVGRFKPSTPLTKCELTLTRYSSGKCDYDGLVHSFKPVLDGLVTCGVLVSDTMAVTGIPKYAIEPTERNKGKIRIQLRGV